MQIRAATHDDLDALTAVYNHYVLTSPATFDIEPFTAARRHEEWLSHYATSGKYRLLVADVDGAVAGYASTSKFRPKPAYETSVEFSVYIAPAHLGRGLGTALYTALFEAIA